MALAYFYANCLNCNIFFQSFTNTFPKIWFKTAEVFSKKCQELKKKKKNRLISKNKTKIQNMKKKEKLERVINI